MIRVRTVLTGWSGAPGYQTFYFSPISATPTQAEVNDVGARVRTFWSAIAGLIAIPVGISVQPGVDFIDPTNGQLTGSGAISPVPAVVVGTAAGDFYAPGIVMNLTMETGVTQSGRRVRGRSFIGPITESIAGAGTLLSTSISTLQTAAGPLIAAGTTPSRLLVWSRPKPGRAGGAFFVTATPVPSKLAHLRSRRD